MEEKPLKVLIPMAGMGKRFTAAGHASPKPLIEVDGRPMIEHVVKNFSPGDDFVFGINQEHERTSNIREVLSGLAPSGIVVSAPYQKDGVVEVLRGMTAFVRDEEPVIVNYCDFLWVWDYRHFRRIVSENSCDGAVVCYTGFHPHLLGSNVYATLEVDDRWMKGIREKSSSRTDKTRDWTSSGTYYFKSGALLKSCLEKIRDRPEWAINGELYVSQLFQILKERDRSSSIYVYEIPFMLQWGTPEDLEDYRFWSKYFDLRNISVDRRVFLMNVLVLMAGAGKRFSEAGYALPKPLIDVLGESMVIRAVDSLPRGKRHIFVAMAEALDGHPELGRQLEAGYSGVEIVRTSSLTEGQASTALLAADRLPSEEPLLIGACDHGIRFDPARFAELTGPDSKVDALIFTHRGNPCVRKDPRMYGWVRVEGEDKAIEVSVKVPISDRPLHDDAIVGAFWFRRAGHFIEGAREMIAKNERVRNEFYIDTCLNHLIKKGLNVRVFRVDQYVSWGTPDDLKIYDYWSRYFGQSRLPQLSVVIPCYNEAGNIPVILEKFGRLAASSEVLCELILVDNGSTDGTGDVMEREIAHRGYTFVKKVTVEKNVGYGHGLLAGLREAKGDVLAWTHADLQTDPEDIFKAVHLYGEHAEEGEHVFVKGTRVQRSIGDKIQSFGMQLLASICLGTWLSEINAQPKMFPRSFLGLMKNAPSNFSIDLYAVYLAKRYHYKIVSLPVRFHRRGYGVAKGGGGGLQARWRLIARTVSYIFELRTQLRQERKKSAC